MSKIFLEAKSVEFIKVNSEIFNRNLMMIDTQFSKLMAYALIYYYWDGINDCDKVLDKTEQNNPMGFPTNGFYKFKFKKFLCSAALWMTPNTAWDGLDEANGGYIIATASGDVLTYHIYNRNFFEEYLLKQTCFERAPQQDMALLHYIKKMGKLIWN